MEFKFNWEGNREKIAQLKDFIEKNKEKKGALMMVLHEAQDLFGYLPIEIQQLISEELKVPLSEIYGVATFYSQFTLIPKGENVINICLGTACYVKGGQEITDKLEELLGIKSGETTPDRKFSIDTTRCIGACGLAPVIAINGEVYGKITVDDVEGIIEKYK